MRVVSARAATCVGCSSSGAGARTRVGGATGGTPVAATGGTPVSAGPRATVRSGSSCVWPARAAASARPRSPADWKRSAGFFASARASVASTSGSSSGRAARAEGGGSFMWAKSRAAGAPWNGGAPVSDWKARQPSA